MDDIAAVLDRRLERDSPAPLTVAFSGGGDSLYLLLAAKLWADRARRRLIAVTIDHGLQAASADWARWCADRARRLGLAHRTLAWDGERPITGVAARARRARHRLLAEATRAGGANVILMGHTFDDVLEARAMRAAGGSVGEPRQWSPSPVWPEGRGLFLLRPMLSLRRELIRVRLRELREAWIDDPANLDMASARARLRASRPEERREGAESARRPLLAPVSIGPAGEARLSLGGLAGDDRPRLLGAALLCVGGGERPPRRGALESLLARLGSAHESISTMAGARIEAGGARILITREQGSIGRREPLARALRPGEAVAWDGRFELLARAQGLSVRPLAGVAGRLSRSAAAALRRVPAGARGALPAIIESDGAVRCPVLEPCPVEVDCLVGARLAGAVGAIDNEAIAWSWRRRAERTKSG